MDVTLKFLGAAGTVTGSKYLLRIGNRQILIDCGMFQGPKELRLRNRDPFPIDPQDIGVILLTHAHIDHTGYLPRLIRQGFKGRILCTKATADLLPIMLKDAARLQEEEAEFAFRRGYSRHSKPEPLFTVEDAEAVMPFVQGFAMSRSFRIDDDTIGEFRNAGHILGAASLGITLNIGSTPRRLVFSGDIGRFEDPIMHPPAPFDQAEILVVESTYGDRNNPMDNVEEDLRKVILEALHRGGPIIIPAFAVGRTQTLIYHIQKLIDRKAIPRLGVYVDSPMAISVTNLYEKHSDVHRIEVVREGNELISLFDDSNIHYCRNAEQSKALNEIRKPVIIISASGMCTGGRILHHLYHRLPDPTTTFLFAGYQAHGTRGRDILEGRSAIKVFGQLVPVRCAVAVINGLSAHADQKELLQWVEAIRNRPKRIFVTHGEPAAAEKFARLLRERYGMPVLAPEYLETVSLYEGV